MKGARRIFNRSHRGKYAALTALGLIGDGLQQVLPYLPEWLPRWSVLALTGVAVLGGVVSHFVQPAATNA